MKAALALLAATMAVAAQDAYTPVLASPAAITIAPTARSDLKYDPAKDLVPVAHIAEERLMLVAARPRRRRRSRT